MKIALLSFHNAANYGAALQAYALQKALQDLGFECEYINYQNRHRRNTYSMWYHILHSLKKKDIRKTITYLLGTPFMTRRKINFGVFYKHNLKTTVEVYSNASEARSLNNKYDKFIVGSDQVWNSKNNGNDNVYLLSFVDDDSKKISYSSSFGLVSIPPENISNYSEYLSRIKFLSVREQYGVELVNELTNKEAVLVLDPVFLLSKEQWLQIAKPTKEKKSFIFSYTNRPNQLESFLNTTNYNLSNSHIYKLARNIKPFDFIDKNVRVKYTMSPSEFLGVIRDAEVVISASFHCIALSIIFNKPFVAILTGNKGKDERILNILSMLGLENRIYSDKMTLEQVHETINYDLVNNKIDKLKENSMDFLIQSINSN